MYAPCHRGIVAPAERRKAEVAGEDGAAAHVARADAGSGRSDASPCLAWSRDWLRQIYGQCVTRPDCRNEFGYAWRYLVPETKRPEKAAGVCLCKRYTDQQR